MNRLKLFILIFFISISIPLTFVIWQTYAGLAQEERAQLRFFSETLFDQMEKELADLVQREENRTVDEYQHFLAGSGGAAVAGSSLSPLAQPKYADYILGYLQNNPDGSMQTPVVADMGAVPGDIRTLVAQLKKANNIFNQKKFSIALRTSPTSEETLKEKSIAKDKTEQADSFSERFLSRQKSAPAKKYLGRKQQRVEEITLEQAYNIASEDQLKLKKPDRAKVVSAAPSSVVMMDNEGGKSGYQEAPGAASFTVEEEEKHVIQEREDGIEEGFQVEVAPFQSVSINDNQVYIFRRIAIKNQIYRQGFLLKVEPFLRHLIASHFLEQPLAGFTHLRLQRRDLGANQKIIETGVAEASADFVVERIFPPPFDFLSVSLRAHNFPLSPVRNSLNVAIGALAIAMLLGLFAIYQSARSVVAMSERRSQFVSSVTHELKTPLTNIRMYIEMLEQGVAATPEREQEYLAILGSESTRLSGLINNVLDLAKLEKKQRSFHMEEGDLDDVLSEVATIMSHTLKQEGFTLAINAENIPSFNFDRDVLVQILMNLLENSIKFGKHMKTRHITISAEPLENMVRLSVSDTGPGIPRRALKKVFDDFYRVDNDLTRATGGTGIGLALVQKFVIAMGGSITADNNAESGCTITLLLPAS